MPYILALALALFAFAAADVAAQSATGYVNYEVHPVRPLDRSPDGRRLAVAHTDADRLVLLDIDQPAPLPAGSVPVGLRPVAAAFRDAGIVWVANHLSDSISVVDVAQGRVVATIATADEPYDIVFAGSPRRAFVSCSQANRVQVFEAEAPYRRLAEIEIAGEDPRALARSPDGQRVYAAVFESGNATTVLAGATFTGVNRTPANVVLDPATPYGGVAPPPNAGGAFDPPLNPSLPPAPATALIVRRDANRAWRDDNGRDWSPWVSGDRALASGRVPGWDMADHDIAVIDTASLSVSYAGGRLSTVMALAVDPSSGAVTAVGLDARNEVRFEPRLRGRFVDVVAARLAGAGYSARNLNPHLPASGASVEPALRERSLGDPRAIVFRGDGARAWIAGMGSNNVVVVGADGARTADPPIEVGEGPAGLALDEARARLYVWNHFEASLSVVDTAAGREVQRLPFASPLPAAVRSGRALLYDTHLGSGTGHLSCASCHVDARTDRLAWDLGNPAGSMKPFNQNCLPAPTGAACADWHPMKGPMVTQTLQDIVGHEPFHWRGDREGIEAFNQTFVNLQGREAGISAAQMQRLEDFLASIAFAPNPWRREDNSLPTTVDLASARIPSPGRFSAAGSALPPGNAQRGLQLFGSGRLVPIQGVPVTDSCAVCHSLPTGLGVDGGHIGIGNVPLGGSTLPRGPFGERHLTVAAHGTLTNRTMKIPSLRNLHERTGFDTTRAGATAGFGFTHDGTVDSIARFMALDEFAPRSDADIADLTAFMLAFSGSDLPPRPGTYTVAPPSSNDSHAAVGASATATRSDSTRAVQLVALAQSPRLDLVVRTPASERTIGWLFDRGTRRFSNDEGRGDVTLEALLAELPADAPAQFMLVAAGSGRRLSIDRDGDGILDGQELQRGSLPWDAGSTELRPSQGFWSNPARDGHGFDVQLVDDVMAVGWYTYEEDGRPTWYSAAGPLANARFSAPLLRYTLPAPGQPPRNEQVGEITFTFESAERGRMEWRIGARTGSEPVQRLRFGPRTRSGLHTGIWFDPADSGWGISIDSQGDFTVIVVYFYDAAGQPRWSIGTMPQDGTRAPMVSPRGFAPWQAVVPLINSDGGDARIARRLERRIDVDLTARALADPASDWRRRTVVQPITTEPRDPWAQ